MFVRGRGAPSFDAVLVVKWDRFSRDATGALGMIRRLDARGVVVQAIEQPIDTSVPEQLLMQVLYVAAPEVENRRRSLATRAGMRRAMLAGRYVNVPPKGYKRSRDERDRYVIVPNGDADFVRAGFAGVLDEGRPLESVLSALRREGFACSKNQFGLLLRNPLYAGRIVVPAWGDEPERVVTGVHEPLVDLDVFEAVQRRLARPDNRRVARLRLVPELPLRGHLLCPRTGVRLTGSRSRSRSGAHVWYYHGQGVGVWRVRADAAHAAFEGYLGGLRMHPSVVRLMEAMVKERTASARASRERRLAAAQSRLAAADERLLTVDLKYLDGEVDRASRDRLLAHVTAERESAVADLSMLSRVGDEASEAMRYACEVAARLPDVWAGTTPEGRHALLGSIWPAGIAFDESLSRTIEAGGIIGLLGIEKAENRDARAVKTGGRPMRLPG